MTIRKVSGPVVPPPSASTQAAPATKAAAATATPFATSSFTPATGSSSSAATGVGHVDSNDDDVNDFVNQTIDAFASDKPLSELPDDAPAAFLRDSLGLKYFTRSAGQQVLGKLAQYVKDNPDASIKDVQSKMQGLAIETGMITKFMEKNMDKLAHHKKREW
jgi:hypothetical protein